MGFASSTVWIHLLRGAGGLGALWLAVHLEGTSLWLSLLLMPVVIWLFRGCPICWTIGLFETIARRFLAMQESLPDEATQRACPDCPR